MGHQIIQQPDGRFCVWSSYVDEIVITDATADELIEMYARDAAAETRERVGKIIDKVADGQARKAYYQFTMTYDEAVEASKERQT